jgi:hypothetical protein
LSIVSLSLVVSQLAAIKCKTQEFAKSILALSFLTVFKGLGNVASCFSVQNKVFVNIKLSIVSKPCCFSAAIKCKTQGILQKSIFAFVILSANSAHRSG